MNDKKTEQRMTYAAHIQETMFDCNRLYERVGSLRDSADLDEKKYFNTCRGLLSQVWDSLNKLYDQLPDDRAEMTLPKF
jgi:hypothetical protein